MLSLYGTSSCYGVSVSYVGVTALSDVLWHAGKQDIGRAYLDFLLDECRYSDAVNMFPTILGKRKDLWEEEIYKFARIGKLRVNQLCFDTFFNIVLADDKITYSITFLF